MFDLPAENLLNENGAFDLEVRKSGAFKIWLTSRKQNALATLGSLFIP